MTEEAIDSSITVKLPDEVLPYKEDIRRFLDAMVYKLKVHSKKGKWENLSALACVDRIEGEVGELTEAIDGGNLLEVMMEAADVANYAMICSAIVMERGK